MFFGLSIGNMSLVACLTCSSLNLSPSAFNPILSIISCIIILMKIRLELVVSSSLILTHSSTIQEMASVAIMCPKKREMLRRRLVSYRCIVV